MQISSKPGNPAHSIRENYQELMSLADRDALAAQALRLVVSRSGISEKNAQMFERTVKKERTLPGLQKYITNFLLRADGLGVI